ncbi:MAG: glycoside hydrolase family 65 protein [Saprospiraceae bacterium]|nr:glycoside hydrolase family 65 protein [Saprospiraceae bacterium]
MIRFLIAIFLFNISFAISAQDTWKIKADNIDPKNYYGVTLANGVVGIVSSAEPLKVKDVVLNGAYDYYQRGRVSNILKTFNHVNMNLDVDGMRVTPQNISNYSQTLDMKNAALITGFDIENKASVTTEMMSLRHLPYTALIMVEIKAHKDITITPMSVIEAPNHLSDVRNYYAEIDRPHVLIPLLTSVGTSPSGKLKVAASNSFIFGEKHGAQPKLIHEDWDYNMHLAKFHKSLKAGETYKFALVASTVSSAQYEDPQNEAERLTIFAMLEGTDRLLKRHREAWTEIWKSDIVVDGQPAITRDIRFALYHLYSFAREGTSYSLSPMGLSGLGYNGHVFWDTELWMYPPLLMLQPNMARSLLDYRFERLEAARQNAKSHGYKGAMFPWESSANGSEDTPVWALTGPFQHHITGCIGWAFWKYYEVTGDLDWLREKGYPVLKEVADFWSSRVERNGPGRYDINNVIGANEWQENIDNNAFTNGMAITTLSYATKAAKALGLVPNPDWMHVADNIPILKFENGVTKENATYIGETIKQADVNLLSYPLEIVNKKEDIKRDLDYYLPRYAKDGPAMGISILVVLYSRLGMMHEAEKIFAESYKRNEVPPFGVLSECAGGTNPYFATGAGGMLQAVLSGFGGLTIGEKGVSQLPQNSLPKGWKNITVTGVGKEKQTFKVPNVK